MQGLIYFCYFSEIVPKENTNAVYEFGPYRLELREHRLLRQAVRIPLTGKAFQTLRVLVEARGNLVSKQDLMTAVWPETSVEENNLDRNISTLRKALGEQSTGRPFIETVPRVGYRFLAPVTETNSASPPSSTPAEIPPSARQEIRFCVTPDKVRLAYSTIGSGHPIVKVANCFNHLDFEWESPIWRHWVRDLAGDSCIVRYDGRGNGLSTWDVADISFESWIRDLEVVVDSAGLDKFALFGHSQGGAIAIAYAVRHPERVSHLVLCGAYSRGAYHRGQADAVEVRRALETLVQLNWGKTNPSFFQVVTNLYIPEKASDEDQCWFKDLQLISVSPENLVKTMRACDDINVRPLLPKISVPTIVFHSDRDRIAPPEEGRILAAEIPGAQFVPLPSANHILLSNEAAWKLFLGELASFFKCTNATTSAGN
ncbi:MAG TPA: alpha/beta fold hydrolase [Candidatus Limnocylindrales bacterium]|nr:alpha/beta fold hydrolase [Candidatus Limnocylindrales bacterium]